MPQDLSLKIFKFAIILSIILIVTAVILLQPVNLNDVVIETSGGNLEVYTGPSFYLKNPTSKYYTLSTSITTESLAFFKGGDERLISCEYSNVF